MTTNTETPTFRGVNCLHCKAPIPVPAIVRSAAASSDAGDDSQRKSQVFNLRCPYCHKEKPYRTSEIVDFDGTPEEILAEVRPAPVSWYPQRGLARTAKA
jgi:hypothetical protein